MPSVFDIWGLIASILGTFSTIQILIVLINRRLPFQQLRIFDDTHKETETLLHSVAEEDIFQDGGHYITHTKGQVSVICSRVERYRSDAFAAKTYKDEIKQWLGGLSKSISGCCDELKELRAEVSSTSAKAREALAQRQNTVAGEVSSSVDQVDTQSSSQPIKCEEPSLQVKEDSTSTLDSAIPTVHTAIPPSDVCVASSEHNTGCTRSASTDILPPYHRNSIPPPYPSPSDQNASASTPAIPTTRTATVLVRGTPNEPGSSRSARKLLRACRRTLLSSAAQGHYDARYPPSGASPATSFRDLDRPSVSPQSWKALRKARDTRSVYVAVVSYEAMPGKAPDVESAADIIPVV